MHHESQCQVASGECVEIHAAFSNSFLCCIDQCSQPEPGPELMLPTSQGQVSRPLIQVIENPQDVPSEAGGNSLFNTGNSLLSIPGGVSNIGWQNPMSAELAGAVGLQMVRQRYLLPIRCSITKAPWLRLKSSDKSEGYGVWVCSVRWVGMSWHACDATKIGRRHQGPRCWAAFTLWCRAWSQWAGSRGWEWWLCSGAAWQFQQRRGQLLDFVAASSVGPFWLASGCHAQLGTIFKAFRRLGIDCYHDRLSFNKPSADFHLLHFTSWVF